jgi:hypothetical protein
VLAGSGLGLLASGWTVCDQLEIADRPPVIALALTGAVALLVARPFEGALLVFFAVPFFGNRPGGHYMEVLNLPLAASTLGLCLAAWRGQRPPPGGRIFRWAGLALLTALVALVPALPGMVLRAAQVNDFPLALVQSLTSSERDPLYPAGALLQLVLAMTWAYALTWAGADAAFARRALRAVAGGVLVVALLGALDSRGIIDLHGSYLTRLDPNTFYQRPDQSIFWNPSWLGMYFTFAFGLSLGLLWSEPPRVRSALGLALAASYLWFLVNPQRGGFLAMHAALAVAAGCFLARAPRRWRGIFLVAACALVAAGALLAMAVFALHRSGAFAGTGLGRVLTESGLDENRRRLWLAALAMWRSAPVFGIGESAFALRFHEFVPEGSALDLPFYGDAHNSWLQILATRGLVGLLAWLGLLGALLGTVSRAIRAEGAERAVGVGVACGLAAFVAYSLFQAMFYLQAVQVLFWGAVAVLVSACPDASERRHLPSGARWAVVGMLALALLLQLRWSRALFREMDAELLRQPRGFYPLEPRSGVLVRWSSRKGTLCLYPKAPVAILRIIPGSRPAERLPVTVTLRVGERLVDRFEIPTRAAVERQIDLPESIGLRAPARPIPFGECLPDRRGVALTVEASSVWSAASSGEADNRHRGVALTEPTYGPP